ncbi:MAG: PAS domain S-box protein, partial [Gallionella sp.]
MFLSQQIKQVFAHRSIALLVCGLILAAWFGETLNNEQYISASRTAAQDQLGTIRSRLEGNLYGDIQLVKGLVSVVATDPQIDQAHFSRAAKPLFDGGTNLRNIGAAPNMVISMMYPLAGNEKAIGLDYRKTPSQFEMAEKARTNEKMILAGPLTLAQGGYGIIGRIPVFTEDQSGKRQFWGLISAVIDADKLYRNSGLLDKNSMLEIAIRGKDGAGSQGSVFFGRADLFDSNPAITEILLPVGSWQIAAVPRNGWPVQAGNTWIFRLIFLLVILLITLPFFALRRSLDALRESESRFRQMFEKHSAVMLLIDTESGQIVNANSAAAHFYGYSLESLRGMNINCINTLPEAKINELIHQAHKENRNYFLFEHRLADGSSCPVEVYSSTMNSNKRDLLFSIIHDISIRKRAEVELHIAATAFEAQEGIMITDAAGVILRVNKSFTNITGYHAEEIIGKSPHTLSSGHHNAEFYRTMWESIALVGAWEGEIWNRRKSGDIYLEYLVITAVKLVDGTITHYVATFKDITERKQAESALQNAHQQLSLLLDSMAEGAYGFDTYGNCTFVNHSFLQMLGYLSQNEVVGTNIHELIHHSHADGTPYPVSECRIYASNLRNENLHCDDEVFWHRLGVPIPVEYWSRPIINDGVLMGGIVTFIDISERKEAEEKLRYSEQRFHDVSDAAGEYLWELDTNMIYTYVSTRSIDVKGYTPEELLGKSPMAFMPEGDIENVGNIINRAITSRGPFKLEHR